jgi:AmpD protein
MLNDETPRPHAPAAAPLRPLPPLLTIDSEGWCPQVQQSRSPNFGQRPAGMQPDLLVIHNISLPLGQFGTPYIADLFCNRLDTSVHPDFASLQGVTVSAHFLLHRDGRIVQFVSTAQRAWHAGLSSFEGRNGCNDFSIGIEIEGSDFEAFETQQYASLAQLTFCLQQHCHITAVCGHQDIAPGRKTDPGPYFDWRAYRAALAACHSRAAGATAHANAAAATPPALRFSHGG